MGELTTGSTTGATPGTATGAPVGASTGAPVGASTGATVGAVAGAPIAHDAHDPRHHPIGCPECFEELQRNRDWWKARPEGSRLVGMVVARDDMPSVVEQRNDLARFGVAILDFKHPAPEVTLTWEQRLGRLFDSLQAGDVLVVANERALGRQPDEIARTIRVLRQHQLVVKVLNHGAKHLETALG